MTDVISKIGGIGSAFYSFALVVFLSFFKHSFLKDVAKQAKQTDANKDYSLKHIEEQVVKRVSYLSLYTLHDRVETLEQAQMMAEDDDLSPKNTYSPSVTPKGQRKSV